MHMSFEEQIRERAYHIWLADGRADGQAHEHWISAERAVRDEVAAHAAPETILARAGKTAGKPKTKTTTSAAKTSAAQTKASTPAKSKVAVKTSRAAKAAPAPTAH